MKFKVGDTVLVTAGKDKGKQGEITQVIVDKNAVIVAGVNMYTRNIKPMFGQAGQQVTKERPLATAKIAIVNDKGMPDRIGYSVAKDGSKTRVFKKTGKPVDGTKKPAKKAKTKK